MFQKSAVCCDYMTGTTWALSPQKSVALPSLPSFDLEASGECVWFSQKSSESGLGARAEGEACAGIIAVATYSAEKLGVVFIAVDGDKFYYLIDCRIDIKLSALAAI